MKTVPKLKDWIQFALLSLPFLLVAAFWSKFPQKVVTHWDIHGHPNGWMSRGPGLLLMPLLNLGFWLLLFALPHIDPKMRRSRSDGEEYARTVAVLGIWRLAVSAFLCVICLVVLGVAAGFAIDVNRVIVNAVLTLFLILGNYLGNLRANYFSGIRTPWTLEDPEVWRATHRAGGRIIVFGSLALLLLQVFLSSERLFEGFLAFMLGFAAWCMGYSYFLFRRKNRRA